MRFLLLFLCIVASVLVGIAISPLVLKPDNSEPAITREVEAFEASKPYSLSNINDAVAAWLMYDGQYDWTAMPGGALSGLKNQVNEELEEKTDIRLSKLALNDDGSVIFCLLSYEDGRVVAFSEGTATKNGGTGSTTRSARNSFTPLQLERELSRSFCGTE